MGQANPIEWKANDKIDRCKDDERCAPSICIIEVMANDPEHRRGIRAVQGKIRNRLATARRRHLHEGCKGCVIKRAAHADADQCPSRHVASAGIDLGECQQSCRHNGRACRHHGASADLVDEPAHPTRDEAHDEQRDTEPQEDRAQRPTGLGDDRLGQDAQAVIARSPCRNLADAKDVDGDNHWIATLVALPLALHGAVLLGRVRLSPQFASLCDRDGFRIADAPNGAATGNVTASFEGEASRLYRSQCRTGRNAANRTDFLLRQANMTSASTRAAASKGQ